MYKNFTSDDASNQRPKRVAWLCWYQIPGRAGCQINKAEWVPSDRGVTDVLRLPGTEKFAPIPGNRVILQSAQFCCFDAVAGMMF